MKFCELFISIFTSSSGRKYGKFLTSRCLTVSPILSGQRGGISGKQVTSTRQLSRQEISGKEKAPRMEGPGRDERKNI
ncbi:hypothetical protein [uncultured Dialister sp.]|uniref:hypothetical protein n=1 Tax=uncultured Dialister sp. TaxID=278064 RepID=UPI0025F9DF47|nr:hypothetical protein [uncultured Dialister sp.]